MDGHKNVFFKILKISLENPQKMGERGAWGSNARSTLLIDTTNPEYM